VLTISGSMGISPSNGMSKSIDAFLPPPVLKISIDLPQCGHLKPLIFSIIPITGIFIFFTKLIDFLTLTSATSCGVVTTTAPSLSGINCAILNGSSPVPGGKSIIK